ncbi:MAG: MerR family transcriptional regulator [Oleispira antarctica]|nr:MerR family transcriptional regulator [Oleispira antarctica]
MTSLTVSQLAKQLSISADTVRHYVRSGLINPERDPSNGYKRFHSEDVKRLHFILQAKSLGFSLADIQTIIDQASFGESPCPQVRIIMDVRLKETAAKIAKMQATYKQMQEAMARWQTQPDCTPTGEHICHLIEGFSSPTDDYKEEGCCDE